MSLNEFATLDQYFGHYGKLLGRKAIDALDPLYIPGESPEIDLGFISATTPSRAAFPCQANVINAMAHAWKRTKSLIICGEMGTGKTLLGAAGIYAAVKARIGEGKPYRVLIMAPNHLIDKWEREILMYVPGATIRTFDKSDPNKGDDSYKEVLRYVDSCRSKTQPGRWNKPETGEWVIVGRNQSKWEPGWASVGEKEHANNPGIIRHVVVAQEEKLDKNKRVVYVRGVKQMVNIVDTGILCPKCGNMARDERGNLWTAERLAASKRPIFCGGQYLQEIPSDTRPANQNGMDRMSPIPKRHRDQAGLAGRTVTIGDRVYETRVCGEALWQWIPKPRKWAPARIIHKRAKGLFDYFVLDEMHEEKAAESAQGNAAGKLMAASKRIIGLTGTLIGGRADHLFALLMRMAPTALIEEGFEWKGELAFAKAYGRVDKIITRKYGEVTSSSKFRGSTSMRKGDGTSTVREDVKPGVMPTFFGRHLIGNTIFIGLDELYDDLPVLIDDDRSLIPVAMEPDLRAEYKRVQTELVNRNNELMMKGCMKLMSTMLHTLLGYPNKPFGWEPPPGCVGAHAVGYYMDAKDKNPKGYIGVVSPQNFNEDHIYAKEQALLDLIDKEAAEGRQVWVYCEMTGKRDIQTRLAKLIKDRGYSVKILRANTVDTREREKWISDNGPNCHVIISNPDLVSTGLDFFDREGTFNFCTIVFYQPTYDLNAMRQAGHRHWRIGQPKECRTFYLYYEDTMEHRAVKHVGDKMAAAKMLEGKFSSEGLASLATGGLAMAELARSLESKIDDPRAAWVKLRGEVKAKVAKLVTSGVIANMAHAAHEHTEIANQLAGLAEALLLSPEEKAMLEELENPSEPSDTNLADFFKAMAELGISVDSL